MAQDGASYVWRALDMSFPNGFTFVGMIAPEAWVGGGGSLSFGLYGRANVGVGSMFRVESGDVFDDWPDGLTAWIAGSLAETPYGNSNRAQFGRYSNLNTEVWHQTAIIVDPTAGTNATRLKVTEDTNPLSATFTGTVPSVIRNPSGVPVAWCLKTDASVDSIGSGGGLSRWYLYDRPLSESELAQHLAGNPPSDYVWRMAFARGFDGATPEGDTHIVRTAQGLVPVPPAYQRLIRFHAIGDSNTRGQEPDWSGTYRGGYRRFLGETLAEDGIYLRGVGTLTTQGSYFHEHDGINGALVSGMFAAGLASAALAPDAVIVMGATNNARSGQPVSPAQCMTDWDTLIGNIRTGQSDVPLIWIPTPPIPSETRFGQKYADGQASYIKNTFCPEWAAAGADIRCADAQWVASTMISSDGVHVNETGYEYLGADLLPPILRDLPPQGPAPAVLAREAFRSSANVVGLWCGTKRPTRISGYVSSAPDLYLNEAGTGALAQAATQGTASARPMWDGQGFYFKAGQDDFARDWLVLGTSPKLAGSAFTLGTFLRWFYSPDLDTLFGAAICSIPGASGKWVRLWARETASGSGVFKLWCVANMGGAGTPLYETPWTFQTTADQKIIVQGDGVGAPVITVDGAAATMTTSTTATIGDDSGALGAFIIGGTTYFALGADLMCVALCEGNDVDTFDATNNYLDSIRTWT